MRQDIEKIIQDAASWNLVQNGVGKWSYNSEYPFELDQAVDQILELIKGAVPKASKDFTPQEFIENFDDGGNAQWDACREAMLKRLGGGE